jgi:secreted Zn-dependent insulinase-like peptidase
MAYFLYRHAKNLNSDVHKRSQVLRHTANLNHAYARFSTGTLATLLTDPRARGEDPSAVVREFYDRHYSAGLMRLAVYGRETLEELAEIVAAKFGNVRDIGATAPEYPGEFFARPYINIPTKLRVMTSSPFHAFDPPPPCPVSTCLRRRRFEPWNTRFRVLRVHSL